MKSLLPTRFFAIAALSATAIAPAAHSESNDLRVLYAGNLDSDRTAAFTTFLSEHFDVVESISYEAFTASDAAEFDVVIFDWTSVYARLDDGAVDQSNFSLNMPAMPRLPDDWDRPSILIGAPGERIAEQFRSKIDWL